MAVIEFLNQWGWWIPVSSVLGGLILLHIGLNLLYKKIYPKHDKKGRKWSLLILKTLYRPVKLLLWFSGLSLLASMYAHNFFDVSLVKMIANLLKVGFIFCLVWGVYIFVKEGETYFLGKKSYDQTTIELFSKLSMFGLLVLTLLLVLPIFGVQIGGLLAFGGFSGIAATFAAREALANVFGGVILAIDKPFRIGDWIHSQDEKLEGHVEHIGWRMTKLRQFDKRPLYIPNSMFSSMVFINASQMTNRRIFKRLEIRYEDVEKAEGILVEIREYIKNNRFVDQNLYNFIHFDNFGENGVELLLRIYLKSIRLDEYLEQQEKILFDIYQIISKNGAEMAYNTSTVHFRTNVREEREAIEEQITAIESGSTK